MGRAVSRQAQGMLAANRVAGSMAAVFKQAPTSHHINASRVASQCGSPFQDAVIATVVVGTGELVQ